MSKRSLNSHLAIEINQVVVNATVETAEEFAARLAPLDAEQRTLVYLHILSEGLDDASGLRSIFRFWRGRHAIFICRALEQAGLTEKYRLFSEAILLFGEVYPTDDAKRAAHFGPSDRSKGPNDFDERFLAIASEFGPLADLTSAIEKYRRLVGTLQGKRGHEENDRNAATYKQVVATVEAKASPALGGQFKRFDQKIMRRICARGVRILEAPLRGPLKTNGVPTLVIGDLDCTTVDLTAMDDGGSLFIVLGNIRCENFLNAFETTVLVDGDLVARSAIVNGFEDASLTVVGTLAAKLFLGFDVWAEVGGRADIEYGDGYCLPFGWEDMDGGAKGHAVRPKHSKEETKELFGVLDATGLAEAIRNGSKVLKTSTLPGTRQRQARR